MKFKTTKKAIMANYKTIIAVPYADLQYLLRFENPIAFTSGDYGWNADIYDIGNGVAICTGYRSFGNVKAGCIACCKYNQAAKDLIDKAYQQPTGDHFPTWNECAEMLRPLIEDFIKEVC